MNSHDDALDPARDILKTIDLKVEEQSYFESRPKDEVEAAFSDMTDKSWELAVSGKKVLIRAVGPMIAEPGHSGPYGYRVNTLNGHAAYNFEVGISVDGAEVFRGALCSSDDAIEALASVL
jgi:hypothetical protein